MSGALDSDVRTQRQWGGDQRKQIRFVRGGAVRCASPSGYRIRLLHRGTRSVCEEEPGTRRASQPRQ